MIRPTNKKAGNRTPTCSVEDSTMRTVKKRREGLMEQESRDSIAPLGAAWRTGPAPKQKQCRDFLMEHEHKRAGSRSFPYPRSESTKRMAKKRAGKNLLEHTSKRAGSRFPPPNRPCTVMQSACAKTGTEQGKI